MKVVVANDISSDIPLTGGVMKNDRQHYVRVTGVRDKKFVEFNFSIGDPTLYVELMMPFAHFRKFCDRNNARELTTEQCAQVDYDQLKWRNGQVGADL